MTTLDRDKLKVLIEVLQLAKKFGFESLSSPIDLLLEAGIDLCLLLSKTFYEGGLERASNPSLIFDEGHVDALNNPRQIRLSKKRKVFWDPELSEIFKQFASFLVRVKHQDPGAKNFMFEALRPFARQPLTEILPEPTKTQAENFLSYPIRMGKEVASKVSKQRQDAYYRRQNKRSLSKYSQKPKG